MYSYTAGRVTEIEYYYFNDGDWEKDNWREEFEYDENGNLIEWTEIDEDDDEEWSDKICLRRKEAAIIVRYLVPTYIGGGISFTYPMPTKSTRRDGIFQKTGSNYAGR